MRLVPSRSAATVSASLLTSRVGRASSSLMCTWMTAAPAASHSLDRDHQLGQGDREGGHGGLVGFRRRWAATVISVLLPAEDAAMAQDTTPDGQVLPGEGQRLGQVRLPVLLVGARLVSPR